MRTFDYVMLGMFVVLVVFTFIISGMINKQNIQCVKDPIGYAEQTNNVTLTCYVYKNNPGFVAINNSYNVTETERILFGK